ncbi:hypothetical protein [Clostridium hydrogeniformans]|uniref:hypothetical protein n=1 Tax=Clostridium hydrogeniformans TaxID=349933 RepID=UPI000486FF2F|nr:hypothetical protein [Clostridium hydrogeniformans]
MKFKYDFSTHSQNIDKLNKIIRLLQNNLEEYNIKKALDLISSFSEENKEYMNLDRLNMLLDKLGNILSLFHSDKFNEKYIKKAKDIIYEDILQFFKEFIEEYKVNLWFKGEDKYNLIGEVINSSINFKGNYNEDYLIDKKDKEFDILIFSERTSSHNEEKEQFDHIIYYDRLIDEMFNKTSQIYSRNHDYNFLVNTIEKAKDKNTEVIIAGSSYSLYGIDEKLLSKAAVNLSLPSQDLYYSLEIMKNIIKENNNIRYCILGQFYYCFHFDLSKSINNEVSRIENVYYPIFKDSHNYNYGYDKIEYLHYYCDEITKFIFNLEDIYYKFIKLIYKADGGYFTPNSNRQWTSLLRGRDLVSLSEEEKVEGAKWRAGCHNKMLIYEETKKENIEVLKVFLDFCNHRNIQPIVLILPATKYYRDYFSEEYKKQFYEGIEELQNKFNFKLMDFYDSELFQEEDFVDFDHMSDKGAYKLSNILNEYMI